MAQAVLSRRISSIDLTSRASSMTCWPSRTVTPASVEGGQHRRLDDVDAERHVGGALGLEDRRDLARRGTEQAGVRGHGAAQPDHPGMDVLRPQPRAVQPVVLGGRAEVPDVRVAAAGQQRVAGHLVARPLADVGARDVADVVEVEQQDGADVRRLERGPGARQPVRPQALDVPALLPVDVHRAGRGERGGHRGIPCAFGRVANRGSRSSFTDATHPGVGCQVRGSSCAATARFGRRTRTRRAPLASLSNVA